MKLVTNRRTAIASLTAGAAGLAVGSILPSQSALAALSSGAGVVAGGSLEGPNGPIQFSAFGSRLTLDDVPDRIIHGAFSWYDAAGAEGEPLALELVTLGNYGPGDLETARTISGTVSVNGEGEHPFGLWLVDNGPIGSAADSVRLVVGSGVAELTGTPVPAGTEITFDYEVEADLTAGDVQLIKLA
jgi:hypothetical protein